jgi:hypothetical protein
MTKTIDDLERLEALRSAGVLGDSEFDALKSKILAGNASMPDIDSEQPYEVSSDRFSSNDETNFSKLLIVFLAAAIMIGGFFYFSAGTDSPASGADDPEIADIQANVTDTLEPDAAAEPEIQYDFKINQYKQTIDYEIAQGTILRYELINRSTSAVQLSSVTINKRDDCVAYIRNKNGKLSLSQDSKHGDIQDSSTFGVGMAVEIIYDWRKCGELIYADVMMADGSVHEMKAL